MKLTNKQITKIQTLLDSNEKILYDILKLKNADKEIYEVCIESFENVNKALMLVYNTLNADYD